MTALPTRIQSLGDADAKRILATFARHQPGYRDDSLSPQVTEALRNEPDLTAVYPSEGDLARAALLLLADDPTHRQIIETMVSNPPPERLGVVETAAVTSAVLFVLGTHVKIERDKDGRWTFKLEKKPTEISLLKSLMQKIFGFTQGGA